MHDFGKIIDIFQIILIAIDCDTQKERLSVQHTVIEILLSKKRLYFLVKDVK